jgi:hypothetical protein
MRVRAVDGTQAQGAGLAARVLREMPADVPLPEPWVTHAGQGQLLDGDGAHWFVEPGGGVRRVVWLRCSCRHYEATWYRGGLEISRVVHVLS